MNRKMARPPHNADNTPVAQPAAGYGMRSLWPLAPVGEAARRDPRVPDPVPNSGREPKDQADASPPVARRGGLGVGSGIIYEGLPAALVYVKTLGTTIQHALARNYLSGVVEARWRVGGVSYPADFGFGPGYHGDAQTAYPNNPQVYLRNPGIRPLAGVPQTFRYAPNMGTVQDVGPSIADVGKGPKPAA